MAAVLRRSKAGEVMECFYILDGLEAQIQMSHVLHAIDCAPDSPVYEEMVEECQDLCPEMLPLAEPVGILGFGELTGRAASEEYPAGTKVIYAVLSVGDKIKQCSTAAFGEGDYVRGVLCDAMADCALFSLEERMQEKLREICAEHGFGILKRLEAPHDISMEVQKDAWDYLELKERFGIDISCGYMFDPVKTSCQIFVLTEDANIFRAQHDCSKCPNLNCKLRNIPAQSDIPMQSAGIVQGKMFKQSANHRVQITVYKDDQVTAFQLEKEVTLMDGLLREGYYISAVCGGKGRCGKCKVRVVEGAAGISAEDEKFFSREELEAGWRLSCMLYPEEDLTIAFELDDESDFVAVSDYRSEQGAVAKEEALPAEKESGSGNADCSQKEYEIAIDIGTTTIAFQLLDKNSRRVINTVTTINSQRKYGADVVSRMQASIDGKREELRESIRKDLRDGILRLREVSGEKTDKNSREPEVVKRIVIGCNTTMGHLLMGYDCGGLGVYPFTPVNIELIQGTMEEILGMNGEAEVLLLPGISTYVGGDIVAGLYACDFPETEEICLLVDLGTNGEMALGNRSRILVTSTAAGPAFEGGNITWGTGSVAGAICSVKLDGSNVQVQTIRDKAPVGICGTGVVEAVAELVREEWLDETGLLHEDYFEDGFPLAQNSQGAQIVLTQKDIREMQLAKAAVRAGVETLLLRYGVSKEQVAKVYLAGGFGYRLDAEKAIAIGMLPEEFADRIQAVGNSCLAGAVKYLREENSTAILQELVRISEEINLSMDKDFNEAYMDFMMFE